MREPAGFAASYACGTLGRSIGPLIDAVALVPFAEVALSIQDTLRTGCVRRSYHECFVLQTGGDDNQHVELCSLAKQVDVGLHTRRI